MQQTQIVSSSQEVDKWKTPSVFFCAVRSEEIMVRQIGTSKFLWNIYLLCVDRGERAGTGPRGHLINLALKEENL